MYEPRLTHSHHLGCISWHRSFLVLCGVPFGQRIMNSAGFPSDLFVPLASESTFSNPSLRYTGTPTSLASGMAKTTISAHYFQAPLHPHGGSSELTECLTGHHVDHRSLFEMMVSLPTFGSVWTHLRVFRCWRHARRCRRPAGQCTLAYLQASSYIRSSQSLLY